MIVRVVACVQLLTNRFKDTLDEAATYRENYGCGFVFGCKM